MTAPSNAHGPWVEHRLVAETIGQYVSDALSTRTGSNVVLGKATSFEPRAHLTGRPLPLRAVVVQFRRPLRDAMIFLSSYKEDLLLPLVQTAVEATIEALEVPTGTDEHGALGAFEIESTVEYDSMEHAIDHTDALFMEGSYALELPLGDVLVVLGTGLLESASFLTEGAIDPHAVEAPYAPGRSEHETGDDAVVGASPTEGEEPAAPAPDRATVPGDAAAGIDAYDAVLAEQERAEAEALAAAAGANAAAAGSGPAAEGTDRATLGSRWTHLLNGVEVELSAELGRTDLTLGDIAALASESVLTLDQLVHEPISVYVNGTRYATARLVVVDDEYGIEILEVLEQRAPLVPSLAA